MFTKFWAQINKIGQFIVDFPNTIPHNDPVVLSSGNTKYYNKYFFAMNNADNTKLTGSTPPVFFLSEAYTRV